SVRDRGGHFGDVADLVRQVAGEDVHAVCEVLPGAAHALDVRLASELSVGAYLSRHAGHLRGERAELIDHGVHGALQLEHLALGVDGDLPRQIAICDGCGDFGDVADLRSEIVGEEVDVVGEVLPGSRRANNLTAQVR